MKSNSTFVVFLFLFLTFALTSVNAQCPTVSNNNQSFCDLESILVGDLVATDNGGGIVWYDSATSTTPLSNSTSLISGEDYYADDTNGTCVTRERVDVIIYRAPIGPNFQGVCLDDPSLATVGNLSATGNDVQWYLTASGGLPLNSTDVLIDDTIYYADQANPDTGCRTSRLSVLVNVGLTPIPTGDAIQEFCFSSQLTPTVADLVASGLNNWYISVFSALPLPETTPLVNGQTYYATTFDPPCESTGRFAVTVVLEDGPDPGMDGVLDLCDSNANPPIDLFTLLGGTPETGGTWSPLLNSGTGLYDPNIDSEGIYTYTVSSTNLCPDASSSVTVTIFPEPNAGENGTADLCSDNDPIDLFSNLSGTPETGGTWSPTLTSGTGIFDPSIDVAGVYTYTVAGTAPCTDATATVTVSVTQLQEAGENGTLEVCGNSGTFDLFNSLGGTPNTGGTWSPALNSGTGIFDPVIDAEGIYTYSFPDNAPCTNNSATVSVTVNELPDAGTSSTLELCSSDTNTVDLFNSLGGTPDIGGTWSPALASGTGIFDPTIDAQGIYTYTLIGIPPCPEASATVDVVIVAEPNAGIEATIDICSNDTSIDLFNILGGTPDTGGTWSPLLNSGTGIFDPATDTEGTYTYTVLGTSPCPDTSATVTISVTPFLNAGSNGTIDLCTNDNSVDLFDSLGGSPDVGGTWSPALASGTGLLDPSIDTSGTYTYTIENSGSCINDSATVIVSIEVAPDAGMDGILEVCETTNSIDLFNSLQGTPDIGGTWSPILNSGTGIFDPITDPEGIYTYTITSTCGDISSTVTVSIANPVDAGNNGAIELCITDTAVDLFNSLGGMPDIGGTWSPTLNSGTGIFDPSIDVSGTYTYTVDNSLSTCPNASATVIVTILEEPNAGEDGNLDLCTDETGLVDLFDSLGGAPDSGGVWTPALNSGTGIFDPSIDPIGVYTYTVTSTECNLSDDASVTITIGNVPDATGLTLSVSGLNCFATDVIVGIEGANQLADGDYTIAYELSGANVSINTISISIVSGSSSFTVPQNLLPNTGTTILTLSELYFVGEICSADVSAINPVEIIILDIATPQIVDEGTGFCEFDDATINDLTANIIDSGTIIWYNLPNGGIAYTGTELLEDGVTYYAALQAESGCESTIRLAITVTFIDCVLELIIPDGFSPNGDAINDDFHIVNLNELYPNFKLSIYNRYGNTLYEGDITTNRWNGTSKNNDKILPVGVYFYILEFNDGTRSPLQGRVYLSR